MSDVTTLARKFAEDHASGQTLVLPTAWDVWSAKLAEGAGMVGLTVGSHPVADSLGAQDGEDLDFNDYMSVVRRITDAVSVPVSVDVESGYGLAAGDLVNKVLDAGAVGLNVEDTVHSEARRVRERDEHADYIAEMRQAADDAGVDLVINGRTDAVLHGTKLFEDPLDEAVERIVAMEKAGARSVYPVKLTDAQSVQRLVEAVSVPVNVTASPVSGALPAGRRNSVSWASGE